MRRVQGTLAICVVLLFSSVAAASCAVDGCNDHGKCPDGATECVCDSGFAKETNCSSCTDPSRTYPFCEDSGRNVVGITVGVFVTVIVLGLAAYGFKYYRMNFASPSQGVKLNSSMTPGGDYHNINTDDHDDAPLIRAASLTSSPSDQIVPAPLASSTILPLATSTIAPPQPSLATASPNRTSAPVARPTISAPILTRPTSMVGPRPMKRANHIPRSDAEGVCLESFERLIRSRADLMERVADNPDLFVARAAYLGAQTILHEKMFAAVVVRDAIGTLTDSVDVDAVNTLAAELLDSSVTAALSSPVAERHPLSVYVAEDKGPRPAMEDCSVVQLYARELIGDLSSAPHSLALFGVYDGHGGSAVAHYAGTHTHVALLRHPQMETDMAAALRDAFEATNERLFAGAHVREGPGPQTAGCTALLVAVTPSRIVAAWAGDSEVAIVYKDGTSVPLCRPLHKPWDPRERALVESRGGTVIERGGTQRVCGVLAVSRAFGNARFKQYITASPDVRELPRNGNEAFMVVACDGLWDVLTSDDVSQFVRTSSTPRSALASALATHARALGSMDNITVQIVFFN